MKTGIKIQKDILELLALYDRPLSTRELALDLDHAWHSIQNNCLRLQIAGKVRGFRVGNMNLWELKK
ncbi:MAG: hypothetical protein V1837_02530 [Candidatus Woesearchaeota archaeon]